MLNSIIRSAAAASSPLASFGISVIICTSRREFVTASYSSFASSTALFAISIWLIALPTNPSISSAEPTLYGTGTRSEGRSISSIYSPIVFFSFKSSFLFFFHQPNNFIYFSLPCIWYRYSRFHFSTTASMRPSSIHADSCTAFHASSASICSFFEHNSAVSLYFSSLPDK